MMGYNFSIFAHTNSSIIFEVLGLSLVYTALIFINNVLGTRLFLKVTKAKKFTVFDQKSSHENKLINFLMLVVKSSQYIVYLILGYIL